MISSGNLTVRYWNWPIEIVDLPNLKILIFQARKLLVFPEAILIGIWVEYLWDMGYKSIYNLYNLYKSPCYVESTIFYGVLPDIP